MAEAPPRRRWVRAVTLVLAVVAIAVIGYRLRFYDACSESPLGPLTAREWNPDGGCTLSASEGPRTLSAPACAALRCEPGLVSTLARARLPWILGLFAMYLGGTAAAGARWMFIVRLAGLRLPFRTAWATFLKSLAAGLLLPAGVAGDAFRILALTELGLSVGPAASTVLLDRIVGLLSLTSIALAFALLSGTHLAVELRVGLAVVPLVLLLSVAVLRSGPVAALVMRVGILARVLGPVVTLLRADGWRRALASALLASVLVSATQMLLLRGLVTAVGAEPTAESWVYVGSALALVVAALPGLPGGIGTVDATMVTLYGAGGVSPAVSVVVAMLYRATFYATGFVGAALVFFSRGATRADPPAPSAK